MSEEFPPEWGDMNVDPSTGELEPLLPGTEAPAAPPADPEPMLFYPSVDVFVREKLVHSYRRAVGPQSTFKWSAEWWRSAEAISRLTAIWRAWEHLRQDAALGASTWWLNHCDPHMRALLDPEGPFSQSEDVANAGAPLPHVNPPEGMFPSEPSEWGRVHGQR